MNSGFRLLQKARTIAALGAFVLLPCFACITDAQTVLGYDASGNRASQAAAGAAAAPTLLSQPASLLGQVGGTYRFSIVAGGTGPFTYQWYANGAAISGATADTLVIANAQTASFTNHDTGANAYSVKVANAAGTVTSNSATLYLDTNGIGIPDWWQIQYFGAIGVDPNADADMDGVSNLQEYLDGTDPTDASARYFMLAFSEHANLVTVQPNTTRFAANSTATLAATSFGLTQQFGGWMYPSGYISSDNPLSLTFTDSDVTLTPLFGSLPLDTVQPVPAFTSSTGSVQISGFSVTPAGSTLVWGSFDQVDGVGHPYVARLLPSGALDPGFNANPDNAVSGGAIQPDGKVVIVGAFSNVNGAPANQVARLNADGSLDTSFTIPTDGSFAVTPAVMAVQRDGKILVGGTTPSGSPGLARCNVDGSLDATFTPGSLLFTVQQIVVQPDAKILLAYNGSAVVRLNQDGSVDPAFLPSSYGDGSPTAVCLEPNGQVLVAGTFDSFNNESSSVPASGLVRLNADGTLDANFTQAVVQSLAPVPGVYAVAVQSDGRVILSSSAGPKLIRLNFDGTLDTTAFIFGFPDQYQVVPAIATRSDDSVLAGGVFTEINSQSRNFYARFVTTNNILPGTLAASPAGPTYAANAPVTLSVTPTASINAVTSVVFEASTNGMSFQPLGQGTAGSNGTWTYPVSALPAGQVYYRAVTTDTAQEQAATLAAGPFTTPPTVTSALTSQTAYVGTPFTYQATATGPLTGFAVTGLPSWAAGVFDPNTDVLTISGTPTFDGISTLTLTPANAAGTGAVSTLTLTVRSVFSSWQSANFTPDELQNPAISGPLGDATGAGIVNLIKYALGIPPKRPGVAGLPVTSLQTINGLRYLTLTYTHDTLASGVTLTVQVGGDLATWSSGTGAVTEVSRTTNADGSETVVTRDNTPVSSTAGRRFMRLQVNQ